MADISSINLNGNSYNIKDNNAVSKSGDTITGDLIVSDHNLNVKKTNADISASTIAQSQYAIIGMTDKNDRYIGYIQALNDTSGATAITIASRKFINNSNIDNSVTLSVNASGVRSVNVNDAEAWRNAINAVNKSGDTVTGQLFIQQPVNYTSNTTQMNFAIGRTAKTYIVNNGYSAGSTFTAIVQEHPTGGAHEEFRLPISYSTENNNTYDILTSKNTVTVAQGGTGKTTHTANAVLTGNGTSAVNNVATASGAFYATKANGAPSFGTLPVAQGGTGVATLTSGAALIGNGTNDITTRSITNNTSKNHITVNTNLITANTLGYWNGAYNSGGSSNISYLGTISKGTWQGSAIGLNYGGTGGTDSEWQPYENSDKFIGTIYYRKVGVFFEIQAQQINLKDTLSAGSYVLLMTVPSTHRPSKEIMPSCFINTGLVQNRVAPMRLVYDGRLFLYANKTDAIDSSYNLFFSGFGF